MKYLIFKYLHPVVGLLGMGISVSLLSIQGVPVGPAMLASMFVVLALFIGARWALWQGVYRTWPNIRFNRQLSWGMGQLICIPIIFSVSMLIDITFVKLIEALLPSWFFMYGFCKLGCQHYGCCRATNKLRILTLPIIEAIVSANLFFVTTINILTGFNSNIITFIAVLAFILLRLYSVYLRNMPIVVFKRSSVSNQSALD